MAERKNSFVDLDDLPTLKPDPNHRKPVDPAVIEQIAEARGFVSRGPKPVEAQTEPQEPEHTTPLQTLLNEPEQTKLTSFNLPLSMRSALKEIAEATHRTMTDVLIEASRQQLGEWLVEARSKRKRR